MKQYPLPTGYNLLYCGLLNATFSTEFAISSSYFASLDVETKYDNGAKTCHLFIKLYPIFLCQIHDKRRD